MAAHCAATMEPLLPGRGLCYATVLCWEIIEYSLKLNLHFEGFGDHIMPHLVVGLRIISAWLGFRWHCWCCVCSTFRSGYATLLNWEITEHTRKLAIHIKGAVDYTWAHFFFLVERRGMENNNPFCPGGPYAPPAAIHLSERLINDPTQMPPYTASLSHGHALNHFLPLDPLSFPLLFPPLPLQIALLMWQHLTPSGCVGGSHTPHVVEKETASHGKRHRRPLKGIFLSAVTEGQSHRCFQAVFLQTQVRNLWVQPLLVLGILSATARCWPMLPRSPDSRVLVTRMNVASSQSVSVQGCLYMRGENS